jgi:hypothetical protein
MVRDEDLRVFARTFIGRRDDYAVQQDDGRYQRVGRALTYTALRRHLAGVETLGTYVIDEQGTCRCAVFDSDLAGEGGLQQLAGIQAALSTDGIPSHLEESRRGGHLWVLLDRLVLASHVRRWLLPYAPRGVEFYPKQDEGTSGYGSLMRVPFGVHRVSGCRYGFVSFRAEGYLHVFPLRPVPVEAALSQVSQMRRASVPQLVPHLAARPGDRSEQAASLANNAALAVPHARATICDWCEAQDPFRVIGRYVKLDKSGLGCCPFGSHHADGKDSHPSFKVYRPKFAGGSCWYCYVWEQGGNVFDFLCLSLHLDAKMLWQRILAGDQV